MTKKKKQNIDKESTTMSSYLDSIHKIPQLKHPEMIKLFQSLENGGSTADRAKKRLIESNLRLVVSIAKQYKGYNMPLEDLIQEGNIGLIKGIERFDWKRGFKFSTYARWWVKQAIGQHITNRRRMIRLPAHAVGLQKKLMRTMEEQHVTFGTSPSSEELSDITGASESVVKATLMSGRNVISLNQSTSSDVDIDELGDSIEDESSEVNPFVNVSHKELLETTREVLDQLSDKEVAILRLRFGLTEDPNDDELYPITDAELAALMDGKGMK